MCSPSYILNAELNFLSVLPQKITKWVYLQILELTCFRFSKQFESFLQVQNTNLNYETDLLLCN